MNLTPLIPNSLRFWAFTFTPFSCVARDGYWVDAFITANNNIEYAANDANETAKLRKNRRA